ncbi:MAG: response regulator, partial [Burkholderiaceae bacterium]
MRLLLIDDQPLFVEGLKFLLAELDHQTQCVTAVSITDALQASGPFDMVLLDLRLPGVHGFAGLHALRGVFEGTPITLLSGEESVSIIREAINEGAMGFVPKSSTPSLLMAAMRLILAGGTYLPPQAMVAEPPSLPATYGTLKSPAQPTPKLDGLSDRQLEVLLKAVQGKPNKVIAREIGLAEGTVKAHLSIAFRLLGVNNRTEAVYRVAQLGLTMPPSANTSASAGWQQPAPVSAPA